MNDRRRRLIGAPAEPFGGFRTSLLLRIAPADIPADTEGAVAELTRQMRASSPAVQAARLVDVIEDEIATINARIEDTWLSRVDGSVAAHVDLVLRTNRLKLEAIVGIGKSNERPIISLALGTVFAIDDLVLFALASKDVLIPDRLALHADDVEFLQPLDLSGFALERSGRFFEYETALGGGINHAVLTHTMSCTPWRLAQASLVSELALAWIVLHERAHWALGHLDLLGEEGVTTLCISETDLESAELQIEAEVASAAEDRALPLDSQLRRSIEGQADTEAFALLCDYTMRLGGAADRYEAVVKSFDIPDDPLVLRVRTFRDCLRVCITAVSLVCAAFDRARGGKDAASSTHPRPASRLMRILAGAPFVSPIVKPNAAGQWGLAPEDRTDEHGENNEAFQELIDAFVMGLADLVAIATSLDTDFIPLESSDNADDGIGGSPWFLDLMKIIVVEGDDQSPCTTTAGIEVTTLKPIHEELLPRLEHLQQQRFGRFHSIELGNMWHDRN